MNNLFINYYLLFAAALFLFFLAGSCILYFFRISLLHLSFYTDFFAKLLTGSILFVVVVSLYRTHGITINNGFLILGILFLYDCYVLKREKKFPEPDSGTSKFISPVIIKKLPELFLFSISFFSLSYYFIYTPTGYPGGFSADHVYYANLSNYIASVGKENASIDYIFSNEIGASPYHYFEIWTTIGLSSLFHLNAMFTLLLLTFNIGGFTIWLGLCGLFSVFKFQLSIPDKIICFFFLFLTGFSFPFLSHFRFSQDMMVFARNFYNYTKLYPAYLFVISSLLLFYYNRKTAAILALLCLPVASISTGPGIWAGVFLFCIIQKYFFRNNEFTRSLVALLIMVLFNFIFYRFFGENNTSHIPETGKIFSKIFQFVSIQTSMHIIVKSILQLGVLYLPVLFICILSFYPFRSFNSTIRQHPYILLFFLILLCSLSFWASTYMLLSAVQVFSNIGIVILNLLSTLVFIVGMNGTKKFKRFLSYSMLIIVLLQSVYFKISFEQEYRGPSKMFLKDIYQYSSSLSPIGAFIYSKEDYTNKAFSYISNFATPGYYLAIAQAKTFPVSLSVFDFEFSKINYEKAYQEDLIYSSPFNKYVEREKQKGTFTSIPKSQFDFLQEYKVNYLIITKNVVLDSLLSSKIEKKITDENTGEIFLLLRN